MLNKLQTYLLLLICMCYVTHAMGAVIVNPFGQNIQIRTRLHAFFGKPSWLIILRDVKTGQTYPYLYDIQRGDNSWVAFSYSRNYLITVSRMQFSTYDISCNRFKQYHINDFCQLESNGRIIRGKSVRVLVEGELSPFTDTFNCYVNEFGDDNFSVASPS